MGIYELGNHVLEAFKEYEHYNNMCSEDTDLSDDNNRTYKGLAIGITKDYGFNCCEITNFDNSVSYHYTDNYDFGSCCYSI